MLIKSHRQESLSRAFIQAIAGRCGMSCAVRGFDYGIDVSLHTIRRLGTRYAETGYHLDIQAKSSCVAVVTPTEILYDLEVSAYALLRDPAAVSHRILVLLLLPDDESAWTEQHDDWLLLRGQAYWQSLTGRPPTTNTKTIRVTIPRVNRFTMEGLNAIMARIEGGGAP